MSKEAEPLEAANKVVVEYYQDKNREWRWRLRRGRNIVAVSGEGYANKADCKSGFEVLRGIDWSASMSEREVQ